jgi:hypothetical protein
MTSKPPDPTDVLITSPPLRTIKMVPLPNSLSPVLVTPGDMISKLMAAPWGYATLGLI